ncbi:D-aminoacyl-tRNA deacylase [Candidatus Scalindua japonica]
MYEYLIERCRQSNFIIGTGVFRETIQVGLVKDGPLTILLNSKKTF